MKTVRIFQVFILMVIVPTCFGNELKISQHVWMQFGVSERAVILERFPDVEVIPTESMGIIQSVQSVNRSTAGANTGALLGTAVGQAVYVDKAFKGSGNNYSAVNHLGAALLGAAVGSTLDQGPQARFEFNYAIKTPDGNIKEQRVVSGEEFAKPAGQCVLLPDLKSISNMSCSSSKNEFLKALSAVAVSRENKPQLPDAGLKKISCRVPGVGLMTLDRNVCSEMEGKEE